MEVGRWISEDPVGFVAHDTHLSRYVDNAPSVGYDPSGLQEPGKPIDPPPIPVPESIKRTIVFDAYWYSYMNQANFKKLPTVAQMQNDPRGIYALTQAMMKKHFDYEQAAGDAHERRAYAAAGSAQIQSRDMRKYLLLKQQMDLSLKKYHQQAVDRYSLEVKGKLPTIRNITHAKDGSYLINYEDGTNVEIKYSTRTHEYLGQSIKLSKKARAMMEPTYKANANIDKDGNIQ